MPMFKDCEARNWEIRIDVDAVRRVRAACGIDLATVLASEESIEKLKNDICLTIDVIYEIVRPIAVQQGVPPEAFGRSLRNDALGHALTAFEEALVDFLPESNRRALARQMLGAGQKLQEARAQRIKEAINEGLLDTAIAEEMKKLEAIISKAMNTSSDTGPSSSDSRPESE